MVKYSQEIDDIILASTKVMGDKSRRENETPDYLTNTDIKKLKKSWV